MTLNVLIAMDSFKGNLTALQAGRAVERGVLCACPAARTQVIPVADGGEGTVEAFLAAVGGEKRTSVVHGPLGALTKASWGLLPDGRAVVELAAASGLPLVAKDKRSPLRASTRGTGEQIREVLNAGCRTIVLGLGGSATIDGGLGILTALGARATDQRGNLLPPCGASLEKIAQLDLSQMDSRLSGLNWLVMCDVQNVLCGPLGAAAVFGPQKGARGKTIERLDAGLANWETVLLQATGRDVSTLPGGGAAGGAAAGLAAVFSVPLLRGIDVVAELTGLKDAMSWADLAFTGEGRLDAQTGFGKVISGLSACAKSCGVPLVALTGSLGGDFKDIEALGLSGAFAIGAGPCPFAQALKRSESDLERMAGTVTRLFTQSRLQKSDRAATES